MIKSIKIQNYKLFKLLSLTNLPQILLIGGKNHSGKTSLLEAFFLPLDCGSPAMFLRHFGWRGLNNISNDIEDFFSPVYHNMNLNENIVIEYNLNSLDKKIAYNFQPSKNQTLTLGNKNSIDMEQSSANAIREMEISYWSEKDKPPHKALLEFKNRGNEGVLDLKELTGIKGNLLKYNNGMRAAFVNTKISSSAEDARRYEYLHKVKNTEGILKALKILEPDLKSLSTIQIGNQSVIHGDIGLKKLMPLSLMGGGIVRLLSILLVISEIRNGLVLIDELENGFHHSILADIWKVIVNYADTNDTQIVATTHSKDLIVGAVEGTSSKLKDKFEYMRIERKEDDFKIKTYNFENLSIALESELEVR